MHTHNMSQQQQTRLLIVFYVLLLLLRSHELYFLEVYNHTLEPSIMSDPPPPQTSICNVCLQMLG